MNTIYDVQQLLMKFGTIIYIGDRLADLDLMEEEIRELYQSQCLSSRDYQMAILLLRQEAAKFRDEKLKGDKK
ncbi:uncharacterized protein YqgQ [Salirhabdus euzebyi]|uniref:Uncharacterized protein YqgQ n=1 Tax=Salirhabdus euzebyi TaxID=394506 RepID=A0A841Q780_9BACI|nr:YqgQ family protein [Salirhabdus euzebyi]MBB6454270.1 uncharacterized protein YqgQ [Salirhabdus euzebyi]